MSEQVVLIAVGVVVAAFVLRPLFLGRRARMSPAVPSPAHPTAGSDEMAELELDRAMGRVSDEDYARWRAELDQAAAASDPPQPATFSDDVESAESLVRRWKGAARPSCATCGLRPEPEARFCSNCGAPVA